MLTKYIDWILHLRGTEEKIIRGVPHILVKWLGWPNKFNQYVPYEDVSHLIPPQ